MFGTVLSWSQRRLTFSRHLIFDEAGLDGEYYVHVTGEAEGVVDRC